MKNHISIFLSIVIVFCISDYGCNITQQVTSSPLVGNDFLITNETPWENTLAVYAPNEQSGFATGSLILSGGQNANEVYQRPIYFPNLTAIIDTLTVAKGKSFPSVASTADGTDNQIIKLKDGSLLEMKNGCTWAKMSNPPYWANYLVSGCNINNGERGSINFYRSTDEGNSWSFYSILDFGVFASGAYGIPRPMDCNGTPDVSLGQQCNEPGKPSWWIGGGDRSEIYQCPYTGNIYVTTRIVSGSSISTEYKNTDILVYSSDNGQQWKLISDQIPGWEPLVMTSTPDGRLFVFQDNGATPTLYYSVLNQKNQTLGLSQGYPVFYNHIPASGPTTVAIDRPGVNTVCITRSTFYNNGKDVVVIAYPAVNSFDNQVYKIITASVYSDTMTPIVIPVTTIHASDSVHYSIMEGNIIQPDHVNMPSTVYSNQSMFCWIEAPQQANLPSYVKACFLNGAEYTNPFYLSSKNNHIVASPVHVGDYMKGAFYWYKNNYNFVAQWPEADGIHCNIISSAP